MHFQNIDTFDQSDDRIVLNCNIQVSFVMFAKASKPKLFKRFQTGIKALIVFEIVGFLGSYGVWIRMNRDQGIYEKHEYFME